MKPLVTCAIVVVGAALVQAQGTPADYERSARLSGLTRDQVYRDSVEAHWTGQTFWYRVDLPGGGKEFIRVDAAAGKRDAAFDHARLAAALAKATNKEVRPTHLPFDFIALDGQTVRLTAFDKGWAFDVRTGDLAEGPKPPEPPRRPNQPPRKGGGKVDRPRETTGNNPWTVTVRDNNLFVRKGKDDEFQFTKDGTADDRYSARDVYWSPDFSKVVALRTSKGDERKVNMVESSPRDQLQPRLLTLNYAKPGDKLPVASLHLFDVNTRREIPVSDALFPNPWSLTRWRWNDDGKAFTFVYNQRGHQVLRLIEVDAATGQARTLINDEAKTFIDYAHKQYLHFVAGTSEAIWMSERDGWNHLYLHDRKSGTVKNQITTGAWVVRAVDRVDDAKRQIWFQASGIYPNQDPYYIHHCRVNYDGTGLVKLTEGDGTHAVRYSPDNEYIIDTYSRVDLAPVSELRRASDGALVSALEKGDTSALVQKGWQAPERFVAKGRDGQTDIYGVIYRPTNFDPTKKYPVIEQIYAGPQGSFVPKGFRPFFYPQEMAELGFITVQIDGMGTSNRSKAFHDVCCKNLSDAGFPDRILWLKSAAQQYPFIDLSRVGVYGGSAGGQNALGALLFHGDFYKAAAADCGCHDNRMDKVWWNELWMGYPIGPHYAAQSNVTQAHKLTGKLLLTVGEVDSNVDPASTMQVVNALIRAGKDFELVVFPGANHGAGGGPYGARKRKDFFVKALLGVEPPERNAPRAEPKKDVPNTDAPKKEEPKKEEPKKVEAKKDEPKAVVPPDLTSIIAKPLSEARGIVRQFEADRGALQRKYPLTTAAGDYARLKKLYADWHAALAAVPPAKLNLEAKEELTALRNRVAAAAQELDDGYRRHAEIGALLPFRNDIIEFEEARRRLDPLDPVKLGAQLTELRRQVEARRELVAADLNKGDVTSGLTLTKGRAERAADAVAAQRGLLKSWHEFYAGFDPLFTWWTATPYKEADAALEKYAAFLKSKSATLPSEDKSGKGENLELPAAASGPADVANLEERLQKPSDLAGVIQRYQSELAGPGRFGKGAEAPAPERRTAQLEAWKKALEQVEFDKLNRAGQIDYIMLRQNVQRDLERIQNRDDGGSGRGRRPASGDGDIVGRPTGRAALLAALTGEMISYSPEQLVELANREYAWCEAEMKKAAREMGFGDDWRKALEKVKTLHAPPGGQPRVIRDLAREAIDYLKRHELITIPPLAEETWRMSMMSPERQKFSPFFLGGEVIQVAFPTDAMPHEAKLQSLRGNNEHFARATVHHELIPGHHLQQFMTARQQTQRGSFGTPFWTEGWAVYWEMVLYERGFPKTPEDRIGLMFWRMHRCARVTFSLGFHLGKMTPQECIDFLVDKVGHERDNATAEVRRSFAGGYPPLYQAAYLIGAKQFWALRQELVATGKMTERQFHDAILKENHMPVEIVRLALTNAAVDRDFKPSWKFAGDLTDADWPQRKDSRKGE